MAKKKGEKKPKKKNVIKDAEISDEVSDSSNDELDNQDKVSDNLVSGSDDSSDDMLQNGDDSNDESDENKLGPGNHKMALGSRNVTNKDKSQRHNVKKGSKSTPANDDGEISDDLDDEQDDDSDELSDDLLGDDDDDENDITIDSSNVKLKDKYPKRKANSDGGSKTAKKKKKVESTNFAPPTNEELHQLKEAENLFHSSLFRLQVTELLKEIQLKQSKRIAIDSTLHKLKPYIMEAKPSTEFELSDEKSLHKMAKKVGAKIPIKMKPLAGKGNFCFYPPSDVKVTGSYLLETCLKSDYQVDIVVLMPQNGFQLKDHLNHRYLRKRALYLTYLAGHLKKCSLVTDLKFTYHHGNQFKPILVLQLQDSGKTVSVHVHAVPEAGVFKLNRFSINKNNVRQQWFSQSETSTEGEAEDPPTPYYNTTILQDVTMFSQLEFLFKTQQEAPGVKDGTCLLKIWLKQRELLEGRGAFTGFILSMYISYLLSKKKLNRLMSSYQVIRSTLLHLSQSDWSTEPLTLHSDLSDPHCPSPMEFYQHFEVVFVDKTGYVNLCADWTKDMFFRVKHEAKLSLKALDNVNVDGFEVLFMTRVPFLHKFDNCFHLKDLSVLDKTIRHLELESRELDRGGHSVNTCLPSLLNLLYKALGQRVHLIQLQCQQTPEWKVTEDIPEMNQTHLTFGLLLDAEHASSIVERGPPADSIQAKEFRAFWGEKSEIRRFQDGGISEAVVWPGNSIATKRLVSAAIVKHILHRHAKIPRKHIAYVGGQLDEIITDRLIKKPSSDWLSTGEEGHMTVMATYNELCKILRNLKDLPLTINTIQGSSPVFRFTEVYPPSPCSTMKPSPGSQVCLPDPKKPAPRWTPTMKVICLLEGSGKWPSDKEAIRRLKAAFYIKLAEVLSEENLQVKVHPERVDVCQDGYVFRLKIAYLHEIAVLKTVKTEEGMVQMRDTAEALALEREIVSLPKLTSTLHGIQQLYNTYSSVSRLAKRWMAAHLLSDFFQAEAIELIVAYLYISPAPYTPPSSPVCGFLRFLRLMSLFDWRSSPLMVNLKQEFTKEKLTELQCQFNRDRADLPAMCIMTPQDKILSPWTQDTPPQIVCHMTLLAKESLTVLESQLKEGGSLVYKQIFRPPLEMYHVLIHLRPKNLPRIHEAIDIESLPSQPDQNCDNPGFPVIDYDPVRFYVDDLKAAYGEMALFFHDTYGGNLIGVFWKPDTFQSQPFKVSHINGRMIEKDSLTRTKVTTEPNMEAILEDFRILGGGLVDNIEVRAEKWNI